MKVKRIIMSIALAIALIAPVVEPRIVTDTTTVVHAKIYKAKTVNAIRKKFNKIKSGMTLEKVKGVLNAKPSATNNDSFTDGNGDLWVTYIWTFMVKKTNVTIHVTFVDNKASYKGIEESYTL